MQVVVEHHYLHRRPPTSYAFGLFDEDEVVGVVIFGTPASRESQKSACPSDPSLVQELTRLWIHDDQPRNTASWFLSRAMKLLPPFIIISYADTAAGHDGTVYRAANFFYDGRTDAKRKLYDYVLPGVNRHSRTIKWGTPGAVKIERSPKHRYWTVTGDRRDRRRLTALCAWSVGIR